MGNKERLAEIILLVKGLQLSTQSVISGLAKIGRKYIKDIPHLDVREASSDIFQSEPGRCFSHRIYKTQRSHTVEEFRQKVDFHHPVLMLIPNQTTDGELLQSEKKNPTIYMEIKSNFKYI